jgi:hypothetical protein
MNGTLLSCLLTFGIWATLYFITHLKRKINWFEFVIIPLVAIGIFLLIVWLT